MIAMAADCSETFHDCQSKFSKAHAKGQSLGRQGTLRKANSKLSGTAHQKKYRSEAQETKLSEPATVDDEHQSTRGFPLAEKGDAPICEWIFFFFESATIL